MKSLLLAPKFNRVLTVSLLGLTLLAQPVKTFAQDTVSNTDSVEATHSSSRQIYVNHTKWTVESVNGNEQDYSPVPRGGRSDGNVDAGDLGMASRSSEPKIGFPGVNLATLSV